MIFFTYLDFILAAFNAAVATYNFTNGEACHINVGLAVALFSFGLVDLIRSIQ